MTVERFDPDAGYEHLADEIRGLTDTTFGNIKDYLSKNPGLPSQLAQGGDGAEVAAARAAQAMYNADVAAAMARAGLRPDGSAEAMIAVVQCLVATVFDLRMLPKKVELAVAQANLALAKTNAEKDLLAATAPSQVATAVVKAKSELSKAEADGEIAEMRSRIRKIDEAIKLGGVEVAARRASLRGADEHARLSALEENQDLYLAAYSAIARRDAVRALRRATRPWPFASRRMPESPY